MKGWLVVNLCHKELNLESSGGFICIFEYYKYIKVKKNSLQKRFNKAGQKLSSFMSK